MSGAEILGIVLGAFPLAISAMERYQETKKAAGTFWRVRKAYCKDLRNVQFCKTIFALHIEELLQPLARIDIDGNLNMFEELLKQPGGPLWKHAEVQNALSARLRSCHQPYLDTLEELQVLMIKLAKETKVEDAQFQKLLADQVKSHASTQLLQKADGLVRDTAFQARRLKYSLTITSREDILREAETYIKRLQDLLAAADRVSKTSQEHTSVRIPPLPKIVYHFWRHAERIYRLMRKSMTCSCRSTHCARLWLQHHTEPTASLGLLLLFAKDHQPSPTPWIKEGLRVAHVDDHIPSVRPRVAHRPNPASVVVQTTSSTTVTCSAQGTKRSSSSAKVSFAVQGASSSASGDLFAPGICNVLASGTSKQACLGALVDEQEQVRYHVFPERHPDDHAVDTVSASELLKPNAAPIPSFYRHHRYDVAMKLAAAQIQFHSTQWMPPIWSLDKINFPSGSSGIDYTSPHFLTGFEAGPMDKSSVQPRDQSLWTLGVVLLELCFGRLLENHPNFTDPEFPRNSRDPFQRLAVAHEWAQDVELEANDDYAHAVRWCLQQSPVSSKNNDWRKDFAENVLQRLKRCCESMKGVAK